MNILIAKIRKALKFVVKKDYRQQVLEVKKIKKIPRYTIAETIILGQKLKMVDGASFLFMYDEIFNKQIYAFKSESENPIILDCGSNIGLSIIYFKRLYPQSKIIAFEPDEKVYKCLEENLNNFNLSDVQLVKKAVWSSETTLEFMSEGADGGRVTELLSSHNKYTVDTVKLRDYLQTKVEFLKLDIEGAETDVLIDCQDLLSNVNYLFVEYHSFVNQSQTLHTILDIIHQAGFRVHIHPPVISPQPFLGRNINLGMDMQLNIFCFR